MFLNVKVNRVLNNVINYIWLVPIFWVIALYVISLYIFKKHSDDVS